MCRIVPPAVARVQGARAAAARRIDRASDGGAICAGRSTAGEDAMAQLPEIDRVLKEAADRGDVPGVVATAATRDGILYEGAFGRRALPHGAAMTEDTVFAIASMTKAITSTAAMQLVEQGKLALDKPVADILPELAAPQVLEGFDAAGAPRLRPAKQPITLRHLLTHTAGFVYEIWNADFGRYLEATGSPSIFTCQNAALNVPLVFDPGEKWDYGMNIDWVGKAVERVSGERLGEYFAAHLFAPIGIKDTAFKIAPDQRMRLAGMHARGEDGSLAAIEFEMPQEPEFEMGGGGLYGTAADYLAFARIFLEDGRAAAGRQVLKPETVKLMAQNAIGDIDVRRLQTAIPAYSNDAEFFPGMRKKWGLGFMISTAAVPGARRAGSLAWAGLANTYFWIDPAAGIAGVILMQLFPFADAKSLTLFDRFEKGVYAAAG
jgi:methyl acetate hydrolase